jgi:hypothetical protein
LVCGYSKDGGGVIAAHGSIHSVTIPFFSDTVNRNTETL